MTVEPNSLVQDPIPANYFRPRARLVSLLGEQLIRDSAVGILELVKNAYDADANNISIELTGLADASETCVVVHDDGHGMSLRDVKECWLSPATGNKEIRKQRAQRTKSGRQLLGEKGVGRFAVQRLGSHVELITKAKGRSEVVVRIDWSDFEDGAYLDEVEVSITERRSTTFLGGATGTRLIMRGAREEWTATELRKLQRLLRRLQNPVRGKNDFHISLACPEYPEFEAIDPATILETAHYVFEGDVCENGSLTWQYVSNIPGGISRKNSGSDRLQDTAAEELTNDRPECGPFKIKLHVWDRSRDKMKAVGLTDRELDSHCGLSIYRDEFRVLPYGEAGDDWLSLDARRINVPSRRVGNRNIVGIIELTHDENPDLRDKTSRDGLQENQAYHDLKALVRGAIMMFEIERLRDRTDEVEIRSGQLPFFRRPVEHLLDVGASVAVDEESRVSDEVEESLRRETRASLTVGVEELRQDVRHQEILNLAADGLRLERLGFEFSRQAQHANTALARLRQQLVDSPSLQEDLATLTDSLNILRNGLRDLVPEGLVMQRERTENTSPKDALDAVLRLRSKELQSHKIAIQARGDGKEMMLQVRPSLLVQVFENLVDNALWWLQRVPKKGRTILVDFDAERGRILFGDTGPGISPADRQRIFEPYFSKRPDCYGLGLYICRERLASINGHIYLLDTAESAALDARGATFAIQFARTES